MGSDGDRLCVSPPSFSPQHFWPRLLVRKTVLAFFPSGGPFATRTSPVAMPFPPRSLTETGRLRRVMSASVTGLGSPYAARFISGCRKKRHQNKSGSASAGRFSLSRSVEQTPGRKTGKRTPRLLLPCVLPIRCRSACATSAARESPTATLWKEQRQQSTPQRWHARD